MLKDKDSVKEENEFSGLNALIHKYIDPKKTDLTRQKSEASETLDTLFFTKKKRKSS